MVATIAGRSRTENEGHLLGRAGRQVGPIEATYRIRRRVIAVKEIDIGHGGIVKQRDWGVEKGTYATGVLKVAPVVLIVIARILKPVFIHANKKMT